MRLCAVSTDWRARVRDSERLRVCVSLPASRRVEIVRERVRSGMAAARARGARIGRPRKPVDAEKVGEVRAEGASWRAQMPLEIALLPPFDRIKAI